MNRGFSQSQSNLVIKTWHAKTGLWIREGYGQTETTLIAATYPGD